MSKRDEFLKFITNENEEEDWIEWSAACGCQICDESVWTQRYYVADSVLFWQCSKGHKSMIENFNVF